MKGETLALTAGGAWRAWQALRRLSRISFENKTVLATGGSRGLGMALAPLLVKEKTRVAICARDAGKLERACAQLGRAVVAVPCDLTDQALVTLMVEQVRSRLGPNRAAWKNNEISPKEVLTNDV